MTTVGPNYPGTCSNDASIGAIAWSNPSNAGADDSSSATCAVTAVNHSNYLVLKNFGFSISGTLNSITLELNKFQSGSAFAGPKDQHVYFVKAGTIQTGGPDKANTGSFWPASEAVSTYTFSGADLTGYADTDVNDSGFGFALSVNSNSGRTASVEYARATIDYTPSGGGPSVVVNSLLMMGCGV